MSKRFLISRLSSLGDVVCSLPAAASLKAAFPDCEIVWVVDPRFAGIVECCEAVDQIVVAKPKFSPASWPVHVGEFDAALDLQGLLKSALCIVRGKSKEKLGYHWQREGSCFFADRVMPDPSSFHIVDQYVDVARAAGGLDGTANFALKPKQEDVHAVRAKLEASGVTGEFIVVNPGAAWATKRWPAESFATVADGLAEFGLQTVLVGTKSETDRAIAASVSAAAKSSPVDFCGRTSVRELVALLSLAKAHLGGDTGSTHLAAGLGKPAIGLYSITRPKRSCPYGQIERCHYDSEHLANINATDVLETIQEATT